MQKTTFLIFLSLMLSVSAFAQTPNEIEGAFFACEGIRRACPRTPDLADCTKTRIDNCRAIEEAFTKIQAEQKADYRSRSIDGVAERLKQQK